MNKSLVLATLFAAVALSACGKKEEVAPAVEAAASAAAPAIAEVSAAAASAVDTRAHTVCTEYDVEALLREVCSSDAVRTQVCQ